MVAPPFSDDTTTEIFGQRISEGNGDSANARVTVSRAGFGVRSRVVNPNAQSSTGYCPWYHSSVHANTMTPEQPRRKAARTCQSNVAASDPSPFRTACAGAHPPPDSCGDFLDLARVVHECHVLSPVEADHDPKPVLQGHVQEPARRTRVDPHHVETVRGHEGEIPCDHLRIQALLAVVADEERAITDASDPELLIPDVQELPADRRATDD